MPALCSLMLFVVFPRELLTKVCTRPRRAPIPRRRICRAWVRLGPLGLASSGCRISPGTKASSVAAAAASRASRCTVRVAGISAMNAAPCALRASTGHFRPSQRLARGMVAAAAVRPPVRCAGEAFAPASMGKPSPYWLRICARAASTFAAAAASRASALRRASASPASSLDRAAAAASRCASMVSRAAFDVMTWGAWTRSLFQYGEWQTGQVLGTTPRFKSHL